MRGAPATPDYPFGLESGWFPQHAARQTTRVSPSAQRRQLPNSPCDVRLRKRRRLTAAGTSVMTGPSNDPDIAHQYSVTGSDRQERMLMHRKPPVTHAYSRFPQQPRRQQPGSHHPRRVPSRRTRRPCAGVARRRIVGYPGRRAFASTLHGLETVEPPKPTARVKRPNTTHRRRTRHPQPCCQENRPCKEIRWYKRPARNTVAQVRTAPKAPPCRGRGRWKGTRLGAEERALRTTAGRRRARSAARNYGRPPVLTMKPTVAGIRNAKADSKLSASANSGCARRVSPTHPHRATPSALAHLAQGARRAADQQQRDGGLVQASHQTAGG
jgi:hypothetical protein